MNDRNLEALKVWYAVFTTIMDNQETNVHYKLEKLRQLRKRITEESPELERLIRQ